MDDFRKHISNLPHVVILGAGASIANYNHCGKIGKKLPSMKDLVEVIGIGDLLEKNNIHYKNKNFEQIFSNIATKSKNLELRKIIEDKVYSYFKNMELPNKPTIYDYLILSLSKKDLIASFNWDPLLLQAYERNLVIENLPKLAFLHGNVLSGICVKDYTIGYLGNKCPKCNRFFQKTKLLYPVEQKNYNEDLFIRNEWEKLKLYLSRAYLITIFGYSAPVTDIAAKKILLESCSNNHVKELAEIEIVDIISREEIVSRWREFFVREHYMTNYNIFDSYLFKYPRRSCESFSSMTLYNNPIQENPYLRFDTIFELHDWLKPLLDEENSSSA